MAAPHTHFKIGSVPISHKATAHFLMHAGFVLMAVDMLCGLGLAHLIAAHHAAVVERLGNLSGKVGAASAGCGASIEAALLRALER